MSYDRKAFSLLKAEQDVDDSKWETSKDGTVVKKQPGLYNLLDCGLYWTVVFTVLLDPGLFYYSFIGPSVTLACFNMLTHTYRWWCCYWKPQWRNLHRANHRRREGRRDGGEYAGGGLCAVKPEGNVPSHGRGDRETKQAAGQDWRQDGRRRRQHRQGQREDTETAEVDYSDAQSNSSYHAHYLKDSRICWLGLLRKLWLLNVYMSKLSCL